MTGPSAASIAYAASRILGPARSTVTIRRKTGETYDETTFRNVPTFAVVHTGPALTTTGRTSSDEDAAGEPVVADEIVVRVAADADVLPDDEVTWDVSDDPALEGRTGTVINVSHGDWQPVRAVVVQLVTGEVDP